MKTIGQIIHQKNFPLDIFNENGYEVYHENASKFWAKGKRDTQGNSIHYETSSGFWDRSTYDKHGNEIYYENSTGFVIDDRP